MKAIAIDGPAGAGKSTLAKMLARELGCIYVDTGALYRAVGLKLLNTGVTCESEAAVAEVLKNTTVSMRHQNGDQQVLLDGTVVSAELRTPAAAQMASQCSALPAVRAFLLEMQRSIAQSNFVVMDGRDIGTVVLPEASCKIFLTAPVQVRAKRRWLELTEKGQKVPLQQVEKDVAQRDYNDMHRPVAPLCKAPDAVLVDTGDLNLEQSFALLLQTVRQQLQKS